MRKKSKKKAKKKQQNPVRMSKQENRRDVDEDGGARLREIKQVLLRNHITRGITPEKLRIILEELGPTFIKLGQIMSLHSDILPKRYCDELLKLNSDVTPMPFHDVEEILREEYGTEWETYFRSIDLKPLGSASIAQVHKAVLRSGEPVIIKVQRKGINDIMSHDISLLHRFVKLMPDIKNFKNVVDLDMVLDEMWTVAQQEMDFLKEVENMEEFARNNKNINYVTCPRLYKEFCTRRVLVMEYIDGCAIDDVKTLTANEYDLDEIGSKFVNNFIKQVMEDGFFHADPHPGNVKIRDGKIVWIDMGMMGRLSEQDRKIIVKGVRGIALHDTAIVETAVMELGDWTARPDRLNLYNDLKNFLDEYGNASMGSISIADCMEKLMEIMKNNHIRMPHGMSMLCRGLAHVEGVLATISPDINMFEIAAARVSENFLDQVDWKKEFLDLGRTLYRSVRKGSEIPSLTADLLKEYMQGQTNANITLHSSDNFTDIVRSSVRNFVIGLCIAALLISSSIICTTNMQPQVLGIPLLGAAGYAFALLASSLLVIRYLWQKFRRKKKRHST